MAEFPVGPISCLWPAETLHSEAAIEDALAQTESEQSGLDGRIDSIEVAARDADDIARLARQRSVRLSLVRRSAMDDQLPVHLDAVQSGGLLAKVRTGSVRPAEIPGTQPLAEFLWLAAERQLGFKCTAGLHHPFPAVRPLTYQPDAPRGRMHGFVNVLVAAGLAWHHGRDRSRLQQVLQRRRSP